MARRWGRHADAPTGAARTEEVALTLAELRVLTRRLDDAAARLEQYAEPPTNGRDVPATERTARENGNP